MYQKPHLSIPVFLWSLLVIHIIDLLADIINVRNKLVKTNFLEPV